MCAISRLLCVEHIIFCRCGKKTTLPIPSGHLMMFTHAGLACPCRNAEVCATTARTALAKNASRRIQFVQARLNRSLIGTPQAFAAPILFPVPIPPRPRMNPCGIQHPEGNQDASEPDVSKVRLARLSNGFPRVRSAQMIAEIEFDEFVQSGSSKGRNGSSRKGRPNTHSGGGILAGRSL